MTIVDDNVGIRATFAVDTPIDDDPRIQSVLVESLNGAGLNRRHLAALGSLLPTGDITASPAEVEQPATPAKAGKRAAKRAPVRSDGKPYRRRPTDFPAVVEQLGTSPKRLAEHFGVPQPTIAGWLRSARRAGELT